MNYCPCCSGILLQHVRRSEIAWFCRHCWQDMPVLTCNRSDLLVETNKEEILTTSDLRENIQVTSYVNQHKKVTGWIGV